MYGVTADGVGITISGGTRIVGIKPTAAAMETTRRMRVDVDVPGDFSPYVLELPEHPDLDPVRRSVVFSFMASCPTDVDCREPCVCPPPELVEPLLDYLAKDYASFRRLLVDLLPTLNPDWTERNPSDLGMALLELLAYEGDRLSYFQDAVANEAYLDTLRARISARRHARLVDYRMHDGRNAWAPVHIEVSSAAVVQLARGTPLFTRLLAPLPGTSLAAGTGHPGGRDHGRHARARPRPRLGGRVRDGAHGEPDQGQQRDPRPHLGRGGVLPRRRHDRGLPLLGAGRA